ncbi:hypothetical protein [Catellatospora chokoriensis]|uniref:Uncharacterized protein n=1 Tax=Catellatospora chokoriensis TaxID=310353 RepID=A0A8J3K0L1_9ACTN|nr:hypothetical protein [Catellatospora chokoriensis]GIF91859.1 hypothetical protein Cch02nite_53030 [Catellatospora chokoriensis]
MADGWSRFFWAVAGMFIFYWLVRNAVAHGMWDAWERRAKHERKAVHQAAVRASGDVPEPAAPQAVE